MPVMVTDTLPLSVAPPETSASILPKLSRVTLHCMAPNVPNEKLPVIVSVQFGSSVPSMVANAFTRI